MMNSKFYLSDMSYFRLSLLSFLRESHPQLLNDEKFISVRVNAALSAYEEAVQSGNNPPEATHTANEALFAGLHFSRYDTLKNILWSEFSAEVSQTAAPIWAIRLLPECEAIFAKYPLSDDFAYSSGYELLYTELTGTIALLFETRDWLTPNRNS